jgi:hypothetical protein
MQANRGAVRRHVCMRSVSVNQERFFLTLRHGAIAVEAAIFLGWSGHKQSPVFAGVTAG